ncbi:MAG TPA: M3 family metallopeptidase [Anaeromyxobacter sp.]|nr:M3 family metallopeptidase [Anaeromyxobacter sp.]
MPRPSRTLPLVLVTCTLLAAGCAARQGPGPAALLRAPPRTAVPLLEHRLSPEQIGARMEAAEAACDQALLATVAVPDAERTFANTVEALEQALDGYADVAGRISILKEVHPEAEVRAAAGEAEERFNRYAVAVASRRDLYRAVKAWQARRPAEPLDPQQARLVELTLRDFRRNGLELSDEQLARLVALRSRLAELSTEFQRNLDENQDSVEVSEEELAGVPQDLAGRLKRTDRGTYVVTTKYPDYYPFMENATSGEARRRLYVAFRSREAAHNLPLLTEAIRLRDEEARLLGYATHADFVTEVLMARSAGNVHRFLSDLREKLVPLRDRNYAQLTALKGEETGDPKARLEPWDVAHDLNLLKKRDYALDDEAIRQYFPAQTVTSGMFRVYERLLGVRIEEVQGADVWDPSVRLYLIRDATSGETMGAFYADLYPRPGKFGHAASAGVTVGRVLGGRYQMPISVLMANFNPAAQGRPPLLSHGEVETLFHEFGHVMHQTLTRARYGSQSGSNVAQDFVEAPSQMLQNWVYEKEVLDLMSGDWRDPSRKLPAETVRKLKEARAFDAGYRYTTQVLYATEDQVLHTSGAEVDPDAVDRELFAQIMGLEPVPGTHSLAAFWHLMAGYDAAYYGYLWSEVYARDMFSLFEKAGVLDPKLGRRYREIILEPGRSLEPEVLLRTFLGREPNSAAFLRGLGLE